MLSICIATYNGARYLDEQLKSILCQLGAGDEIVISDDGSTDDTLKIIDNIHDPRIRLLINSGRHGVIGNFENALKAAQGDYIYLCDQDDVWESNKIVECQRILEKGVGLVMHDCSLINSEGQTIGRSLFDKLHSSPGYWQNLYKNSFHGCCMAMRRELLDKVLPFPRHIGMHDYWIGLYAARHHQVALINKSLLRYRLHNSNASNATGRSPFSCWQKFKFRFWMLAYNIF